jgi:hypothetical protein
LFTERLQKVFRWQQPELGRQGGGQGMAWHTPEQGDLACHPPSTNPLNGEGFTIFIPSQEPQLALHHQGNARGKTAEVVELLTRPQAQGLEGFS